MAMLRMIDDESFKGGLVTGCPGSGKTTISIYRLIRLHRARQKVQLLTFQKMLVMSIQSLSRSQSVPRDCVNTFHKWYYSLTGSKFDLECPPSAETITNSLGSSSLARTRIRELIIDEGQDLPRSVFQALPSFCDRFFTGADNGQQVYPRHGARVEQIEEAIKKTSGGKFARFPLGRNFRNSYETYKFARQFISRTNQVAWDETILDRLDRANRHGAKPTVISYSNPAERDAHMKMVLKNAAGNVAVLCPRGAKVGRYFHGETVEDTFSAISNMGIQASWYFSKERAEVPENPERYIVTTFKSAKGMEFDVVVIPRINYDRQIPQEWYVACTRARRQLFIYRDISTPQYDPLAKFDPSTFEAETAKPASTSAGLDEDLPF